MPRPDTQGEACPPDNHLDDLRADHLSGADTQGEACVACAKAFHDQVAALEDEVLEDIGRGRHTVDCLFQAIGTGKDEPCTARCQRIRAALAQRERE